MSEGPRAKTTEKFAKVEPASVGFAPASEERGSARFSEPGRGSAPGSIPGWTDETSTARTTQITAPIVIQPAHPDRALLTILTGLNAGQVFALAKPETMLGRGKDTDIRIDDVGISRQHARIVHTLDGRYVLEDLRSTNGIFVNGKRVERVDLGDGDRLQIGPTVVLRFALIDAEEEALARQLYDSSTRDALTRAYNRKYLGERLASEVAYAHRHKTHLSVVIFDLDHFKRINDTHGHMAGDIVLRVVSAQVHKLIRAEDVLARYGGEEFIVLVRGIEHRNVVVFAERLRRAVERLNIPWEAQVLSATISLGVASLGECADAQGEALLLLADERLYRAKTEGRNRVCG